MEPKILRLRPPMFGTQDHLVALRGKQRVRLHDTKIPNKIQMKEPNSTNSSQRGGRWPRPPYLSKYDLTPRRYILGSKSRLTLKHISHKLTIVNVLFILCIIGVVLIHELDYTPPMSMRAFKPKYH